MDRELAVNFNQLSYVIRHFKDDEEENNPTLQVVDDDLLLQGAGSELETNRPTGVAVLAQNPFMAA